jgi:hypothetical protein
MKLQQVLSSINQIEKSKFITCLDKLCTSAEKSNKSISEALKKVNKQIKDASGVEITQLFNAVSSDYKCSIQSQLAMAGASTGLLINILTRDGNAVARTSWIEQLYSKEQERLDKLSQELINEIGKTDQENYDHAHRLSIFRNCIEVAYKNDLQINRQANISDDERSILNTLAHELKISQDEAAAIEHLSDPIKAGKETVEACLQTLREMGIIFINRRTSEVLIPDEIILVLNEIQNKELADKYLLRIFRCLSDAELSNILKSYDKRIRGITRAEKINTILHAGINIRDILSDDLFDKDENQNQRKERLKELINELDIPAERLGTTLDERINIIIESLRSATEREFDAISATSYKELFEALESNFNSLNNESNETFIERLRREFELEDNEELDTERLRALSITPHDILYLLSNEEIKNLRDSMKLPKKGNPRVVILEAFASANDKLIENFGLLSRRDLAGLRAAGVEINESELGSKFEETIKAILESLELNVNEELRKSLNTAKDKADILISLSEDDVIVGEAKSFKNGDYAKYSTTSRQVKAYANRCEKEGKRVAQVLIIAPSFSADFIESAAMDTDINISLLTADGLKLIYETYKTKRKPNFSAKLLTKGGLLKAELIAKNL